MQYNLLIIITEIHTIEYDFTFHLHIIHTAIILMCMFPCPALGSFFTLCEFSVFFFRIDQCYITFIQFFFFIHQLKNTVGPGHRHNNCIHLHTDLVDRHTEALIKCQEACQTSEGKTSDLSKCQHTPDDRTDHITDISDLCIDRS